MRSNRGIFWYSLGLTLLLLLIAFIAGGAGVLDHARYREQFEADLAIEYEVVTRLKPGIIMCREKGDATSANIFEAILADGAPAVTTS